MIPKDLYNIDTTKFSQKLNNGAWGGILIRKLTIQHSLLENINCNCLKHQNNQIRYFHNFKTGQRILEFGQRDGKCILKFKKIYQKNTLGPVPE